MLKLYFESTLTEEFELKTGVKQGCLLFTFCIDWIMSETVKNKKRGITWMMTEMLEDLDFMDDIALSSHHHRNIRDKTEDMNTTAKQIGLKISTYKN